MGGKSQDNSAMIDEQKAQAEEARQKETARQGRLAQGLAGIKAAFEGAPTMGTRAGTFDWGNFNTALSGSGDAQTAALGNMFGANFTNALKTGARASMASGQQISGLPAGFTAIQIPGATTTTPGVPLSAAGSGSGSPGGGGGEATGAAVKSPYYNNNRQGSQPFTNPAGTGQSGGGGQGAQKDWGKTGSAKITPQTPAAAAALAAAQSGGTTTTGPASWAIRGPDGRIYRQGEAIPTTVEYDTGGRSGGFGDDFFNKFRQGIVDYYMPQVANQYKDAQDETTYGLARAGTLRSSTANKEVSKLAEQNALNRADVLTKADTGAADLRTRVASERAKAESQLYATEDPTTSVNQALSAVRNISLEQPNLSPLADVFKIAALGGANAMTGYKNQQLLNTIPGYQKKTTTVVG